MESPPHPTSLPHVASTHTHIHTSRRLFSMDSSELLGRSRPPHSAKGPTFSPHHIHPVGGGGKGQEALSHLPHPPLICSYLLSVDTYRDIESVCCLHCLIFVFHNYAGPCGDLFEISLQDLEDGEVIAHCPSCTLILMVIYDQVCSHLLLIVIDPQNKRTFPQ